MEKFDKCLHKNDLLDQLKGKYQLVETRTQICKKKQMYDDVPWDERVGQAGIGYRESATRDQ